MLVADRRNTELVVIGVGMGAALLFIVDKLQACTLQTETRGPDLFGRVFSVYANRQICSSLEQEMQETKDHWLSSFDQGNPLKPFKEVYLFSIMAGYDEHRPVLLRIQEINKAYFGNDSVPSMIFHAGPSIGGIQEFYVRSPRFSQAYYGALIQAVLGKTPLQSLSDEQAFCAKLLWNFLLAVDADIKPEELPEAFIRELIEQRKSLEEEPFYQALKTNFVLKCKKSFIFGVNASNVDRTWNSLRGLFRIGPDCCARAQQSENLYPRLIESCSSWILVEGEDFFIREVALLNPRGLWGISFFKEPVYLLSKKIQNTGKRLEEAKETGEFDGLMQDLIEQIKDCFEDAKQGADLIATLDQEWDGIEAEVYTNWNKRETRQILDIPEKWHTQHVKFPFLSIHQARRVIGELQEYWSIQDTRGSKGKENEKKTPLKDKLINMAKKHLLEQLSNGLQIDAERADEIIKHFKGFTEFLQGQNEHSGKLCKDYAKNYCRYDIRLYQEAIKNSSGVFNLHVKQIAESFLKILNREQVLQLLELEYAAVGTVVEAANSIASYLEKIGWELDWIPGTEDSFYEAFLKSFENTFGKKIDEEDPVAYLKTLVDPGYAPTSKRNLIEVGKAGRVLAKALNVPVRVISYQEGACSDRVFFPTGDRLWGGLRDENKPQTFVFIVNLGNFCICAKPISGTSSTEIIQLMKTQEVFSRLLYKNKISLKELNEVIEKMIRSRVFYDRCAALEEDESEISFRRKLGLASSSSCGTATVQPVCQEQKIALAIQQEPFLLISHVTPAFVQALLPGYDLTSFKKALECLRDPFERSKLAITMQSHVGDPVFQDGIMTGFKLLSDRELRKARLSLYKNFFSDMLQEALMLGDSLIKQKINWFVEQVQEARDFRVATGCTGDQARQKAIVKRNEVATLSLSSEGETSSGQGLSLIQELLLIDLPKLVKKASFLEWLPLFTSILGTKTGSGIVTSLAQFCSGLLKVKWVEKAVLDDVKEEDPNSFIFGLLGHLTEEEKQKILSKIEEGIVPVIVQLVPILEKMHDLKNHTFWFSEINDQIQLGGLSKQAVDRGSVSTAAAKIFELLLEEMKGYDLAIEAVCKACEEIGNTL